MYGSVSRWRVKNGQQQELEGLFTEMMNDLPPGSRGVSVYRSDSDPQEYWIAGRWDSKDVYRANANRPETDANYRRFRALLESDPEWHGDAASAFQAGCVRWALRRRLLSG
jgi:heme-degrading monooxygenase HmoA